MMAVTRLGTAVSRTVTSRWFLVMVIIGLSFLSIHSTIFRNPKYIVIFQNGTLAPIGMQQRDHFVSGKMTKELYYNVQSNGTSEIHQPDQTTNTISRVTQLYDLLSHVNPLIKNLIQPRVDITEAEMDSLEGYIRQMNQSLTINNDDVMPSGERGTAYYEHLASLDVQDRVMLNNQPFNVTLMPSAICEGDDILLLVYVHTSPENYKRRMVIRQTWGHPRTFSPHFQIRVLFPVGKRLPPEGVVTDSLQSALEFESTQYGDILQEDYIDSYRNLTFKGLSALRFISLNCQHVPYILKTDDDTFVNMYGVINYIQNVIESGNKDAAKSFTPPRDFQLGTTPSARKELACLAWKGMPVLRDEKSKWYVSTQDWKEDVFPMYCSGLAYLMSNDVAQSLYSSSFYAPFFWVDDLYITGLLAMFANIKHHSMSEAYDLKFSRFESEYRTNFEKAAVKYFAHVQKINLIERHWKYLTDKYAVKYGTKPAVSH